MYRLVALLTILVAPLAAEGPVVETSTWQIDVQLALAGSPLIYSSLFLLSLISLSLWLYTLLKIRQDLTIPAKKLAKVREHLLVSRYEEAAKEIQGDSGAFAKMLSMLLQMRREEVSFLLQSVEQTGKRATLSMWQKLSLISDIAMIAPMLGLLGTVLGMFYAFYDIHRSLETVSFLLDGLGISVGTTLAGLFVAIASMLFYSTAKLKLVRRLASVEAEVHGLLPLIRQSR